MLLEKYAQENPSWIITAMFIHFPMEEINRFLDYCEEVDKSTTEAIGGKMV
jgi:hypothetical protein